MTVFGIMGRKRHGKDSLASFVCLANRGFYKTHFAKSLRKYAARIFDVDQKLMESGDTKEVQLKEPIELDRFLARIEEVTGVPVPPRGLVAETPRQLMQYFGTDYVKSVEPDYWIRKLRDDIHGRHDVVIPDCRFPDEAEAIRDLGGRIIRVFRLDAEPEEPDAHISESGQNRIRADLTIATMPGDLWPLAEVAKLIAAGKFEHTRWYDEQFREDPSVLPEHIRPLYVRYYRVQKPVKAGDETLH